MTAEECAAALKAYRARYQLTQAQAAEALGIPLRTLQNWEIARYCPSAFAQAALRWLLARPPGALHEEPPATPSPAHPPSAPPPSPPGTDAPTSDSSITDSLDTHLL